MKSKRNKLDQTSREPGPSSVPPSSWSNIGGANNAKSSRMRSALLENREDTGNIPPEYTSSIIPVSPPPLMKWTRNTISSASISDRQPAFEQTILTADKSERYEVTSSPLAEMEHVLNWTSTFSGSEKRASPVRPPLQIKIDVSTPPTASNTGLSTGRTSDTLERPDAFGVPVERRRRIGQHSESSKVMAQNQDPCKHSKWKTSQRCQFCPKVFKYVSRFRQHERVHTGDRPFRCDVCGKSFTQSGHLCAHKRTHTGDRPFLCDVCGNSFTQSGHLCVHKRTHTGERPYKCKTCGASFADSSNLRKHELLHSGERSFTC